MASYKPSEDSVFDEHGPDYDNPYQATSASLWVDDRSLFHLSQFVKQVFLSAWLFGWIMILIWGTPALPRRWNRQCLEDLLEVVGEGLLVAPIGSAFVLLFTAPVFALIFMAICSVANKLGFRPEAIKSESGIQLRPSALFKQGLVIFGIVIGILYPPALYLLEATFKHDARLLYRLEILGCFPLWMIGWVMMIRAVR